MKTSADEPEIPTGITDGETLSNLTFHVSAGHRTFK